MPFKFSEPKLVGILNITPDSFSDGGKHFDPAAAVAHALELTRHGAHVLDIGAESTRPGAILISADDEWARLEPVLKLLMKTDFGNDTRPLLSLDTRHGETADRALSYGIDWINDVGGFESPSMIEAVIESKTKLVVMHSLGVPPSKEQVLAQDQDPISFLINWGEKTITRLMKSRISPDRIILDPGIGFGKTPAQALHIIRNASCLKNLGVEILFGHSRKSLFTTFTSALAANRDVETLAASLYLARHGVDYLRVHDVQMHTRAFKVQAELEKTES
jgi:dihydropteroate synthase